jgi:hypothetical protein
MSCACGCCEGTHVAVPASLDNPPGLDALSYRVATHGTFLETMLARLTTHELPGDPPGRRPLQRLTARTSDDPSIALVDAWATIGDVLTFYQERIANEGYRRTALERRSLVELGGLLGYELRPAISSTAYLAFTIADDPASAQGVTIATGTRAQSLPPPGGLPASFETSEDLFARPDWNTLLPRMEQPQRIDWARAHFMSAVVLDGAVRTLAAGDLLLFEFGDSAERAVPRRITAVTVDSDKNLTGVALERTLHERSSHLASLLRWEVKRPPPGQLPQAFARMLEAFADRLDLIATAADHLPVEAQPSELSRLVRSRLAAVQERISGLPEGDPSGPRLLDIASLLAAADPIAADQPSVHFADDPDNPDPKPAEDPGEDPIGTALTRLTTPLTRPPSRSPAATAFLKRDPHALYGAGGDLAAQLLAVMRPELAGALHKALGRFVLTETASMTALYGLSKRAQPFGATAPRKPVYDDKGVFTGTTEWGLDGSIRDPSERPHTPTLVALDARYPTITAGSWVVVERPPDVEKVDEPPAEPAIAAAAAPPPPPPAEVMELDPRRLEGVATRGVAAYNISSTVTQLYVGLGWLGNVDFEATDPPLSLLPARRVVIHLDAQPLALAPEPILADIAGGNITLDGIEDGLQTGRRLIVTGERTDIPGVTGVLGGEVTMLAGAVQSIDTTLPGDTVHTRLDLASSLSYTYLRPTVKIWGNVAKSTHGETHAEVLGGGDPTEPLQSFKLSLGPLTSLPAANALGAQDTLEVRVDGVLWHETDDLMSLRPGDREYLPRTDDDGATSAIFGGAARLPSGPDNVRAVYRVGSGAGGNVDATKISQLLTRPLGVREVINPLPATGGADREGIESARSSLPLGLMALDRLVSVRDYADFSRARAGIGKASATRISNGHEQLLHVTVAGVDDGPLAESSDLFVALGEALGALGDPSLPLAVGVRELRLIVIVAGVRVQDDYAWAEVEPRLRATMLDAFGFQRRELGEPIVLSKVIGAAQGVAGVDAVDVTGLALAPEEITPAGLKGLADDLAGDPPDRLRVELARRAEDGVGILAAQIAVLSPRVPDTLILHQGLP